MTVSLISWALSQCDTTCEPSPKLKAQPAVAAAITDSERTCKAIADDPRDGRMVAYPSIGGTRPQSLPNFGKRADSRQPQRRSQNRQRIRPIGNNLGKVSGRYVARGRGRSRASN